MRVASEKKRAYRDWTYWAKPVPPLGDLEARLLIIGLAPRGARGQSHRPHVYGRPLRGFSVSRDVSNRIRFAARKHVAHGWAQT